MKQVLIERPRSGPWSKRREERLSVQSWDGEDGYEDVEARRQPPRTRHFRDLLGPLRKWLRKQLGRPWDKVWSEVCEQVDASSVTGRHLRDHVRWEVDQHVRMDPHSGVAYPMIQSSWNRSTRPVSGLYVHPRHGLLCWQEPDRSAWKRPPVPEDPLLLHRGDGRFHQKIAGIWFELRTRDPGSLNAGPAVPVLRWRGDPLQIISKRQLSSAELRALGLQNTPEALP